MTRSPVGTAIVIILIILAIIIIWGLIGGAQAQNTGVNCQMGLGDGKTFCWIWKTNILGNIGQTVGG
jgi:hypothetical protein